MRTVVSGRLAAIFLATTLTAAPQEPLEKILERITNKANERRSSPSKSIHRYSIDNERLGKHAFVELRVSIDAAGNLQTDVLREEGSELMRNRVLKRLIAAYRTGAGRSAASAWQLTPALYEFQPQAVSSPDDIRPFRVKPRKGSPAALEGIAWVSMSESQIVRFEGRFARKPSFWIGRPELTQQYRKIGPYWDLERVEGHAGSHWIGTTKFKLEILNETTAADRR